MSDTRYLPKDLLKRFIEVYKEHPALWKIKSKEYTNKNLKNNGYDALISVCKDFEPNVNRDWVSKKIQSLRGAFRKELKKIEQSQRSGSSPEDIYVPTLWYFELLQFTMDQELPSDSLDNICSPKSNEEILDESITETEDMVNKEAGASTPATGENLSGIEKTKSTGNGGNIPKKRKKMTEEETQNFFKVCTSALTREEKIDEFDAVGANVAAKLKRMAPAQQIFAESIIQKTLTKGLLNKLTESSDILDYTPYTVSYTTSNSSTPIPQVSPVDSLDAGGNLRNYYQHLQL